jgi:hypothetical protein
MMRVFCWTLIASWLPAVSGAAAQFEVLQEDGVVTVTVDGELFTRYVPKSGPKPILWPLVGPTGKEMTRGYPMRDALPYEKKDHVHHRSLWFTHGNVNGVDFWMEADKHGDIVHREFVQVAGGPQATIVTRNDWIAPDGKKVCEDERSFVLGAGGGARWIDVELRVKATEGPVTFGDTKEGSFGVRVCETMKVEAKLGGKIVNSEGKTDGDAWGKQAAWVDYYGPVEGEVLGIAIMNHPTSFRFPTHWHVRTYGLFTANPFGLSDFNPGAGLNGSHTIAVNQEMVLRYCVVLHKGTTEDAGVGRMYDEYVKRCSGGN